MTDYAREVLERAYVDALRLKIRCLAATEHARKELADAEDYHECQERRCTALFTALMNRFGASLDDITALEQRAAQPALSTINVNSPNYLAAQASMTQRFSDVQHNDGTASEEP